jgi:hypothetical protein
MRRRERTQLNWPGGAASRRSVRAVAKLSPLRALMAALGDKSLRPHLDALADLLLQARAPSIALSLCVNGAFRGRTWAPCMCRSPSM